MPQNWTLSQENQTNTSKEHYKGHISTENILIRSLDNCTNIVSCFWSMYCGYVHEYPYLRKHTPKYLTVTGHDTCNLFSNGSEEKHTHTHIWEGGGQRWRYYSKCAKILTIGESEKSI